VAERRKEERYPIERNVIVRKNSGESIPATAANISSASQPVTLATELTTGN
jgi:hypothetical protein